MLTHNSVSLAQPFDLKGDVLGMSLEVWKEKHDDCFFMSWECSLETTVANGPVRVTYRFMASGLCDDSGVRLTLIRVGQRRAAPRLSRS